MNWKLIYRIIPLQKMGWYFAPLDPDLEKALKAYEIDSGSFLDLGTGAGTQAVELAKRGFTVTGTDIAGAAIAKASKRADSVRFLQDDIVSTKLTETYDCVFDRGCFHVLSERHRSAYIENVVRLLKANGNGFFFLKCISDRHQGTGPHRFSEKMIRDLFAEHFDILDMYHTVYQGTRTKAPKALFVVMRSKS
jgi:SAM-dependent methyltransferase